MKKIFGINIVPLYLSLYPKILKMSQPQISKVKILLASTQNAFIHTFAQLF